MKRTALIAAIALGFSAPAFADTSAKAFFALSNDSAAERIIGQSSVGDADAALNLFKASKESSAERNGLRISGNDVSRDTVSNARSFFALSNNSAAERITR